MLRLGNAEKAAAETGMKAGTIRRLRERYPDRYRILAQLHSHAREAATIALVSGLIEDASEARTTLQAGMRGEASRDQIMAAKAVVDCLTALDKAARLDAGSPTEIAAEAVRPVEAIDAELARICAEIEAGRG